MLSPSRTHRFPSRLPTLADDPRDWVNPLATPSLDFAEHLTEEASRLLLHSSSASSVSVPDSIVSTAVVDMLRTASALPSGLSGLPLALLRRTRTQAALQEEQAVLIWDAAPGQDAGSLDGTMAQVMQVISREWKWRVC